MVKPSPMMQLILKSREHIRAPRSPYKPPKLFGVRINVAKGKSMWHSRPKKAGPMVYDTVPAYTSRETAVSVAKQMTAKNAGRQGLRYTVRVLDHDAVVRSTISRGPRKAKKKK